MGWAGGLFEIWPPTEYTPRPLPSHLRLPVPLSPPSSPQPIPGPCLGHISNQTLAQSWPLHTPEIPADSTQRVTPGSFLGSGVLLASFAAQSHLQPSSPGAGPLLLACTSPLSQPGGSLGLIAEPAEVSRSPAVKVASFQGTPTSLLALPSAQGTLGCSHSKQTLSSWCLP